MKNDQSELYLGVAYLEPSEETNLNIIPKNIIESNLFSGDLNKMNSGLTIVENVYHIKNLGELVKTIKVPKKISAHQIIIFQKVLSFKRLNNFVII